MQNLFDDYYFLNTLIPSITLGERPELSYKELAFLLPINLTASDMRQVVLLRRFYDLQNMRNLWLGNQLEPFGNYTQAELEDLLITQADLPEYVTQFLETYTDVKARLLYFPKLLSEYYKEAGEKAHGFLKEYLQFERQWHIIMVVLRARRIGRDLLVELQFEDPEDPFIAQILAEKDVKSYAPPEKYERLKTIYEDYVEESLLLKEAIVSYAFDFVESHLELNNFSFDRVMGSLIETILAEKWLSLDRLKGEKILNNILEGLS